MSNFLVKKKPMAQSRGFGLIETLLTIGAISALSLGIYMVLKPASASAQAKTEQDNLRDLSSSIESSFGILGGYQGLSASRVTTDRLAPQRMVDSGVMLTEWGSAVSVAATSVNAANDAFVITYPATPLGRVLAPGRCRGSPGFRLAGGRCERLEWGKPGSQRHRAAVRKWPNRHDGVRLPFRLGGWHRHRSAALGSAARPAISDSAFQPTGGWPGGACRSGWSRRSRGSSQHSPACGPTAAFSRVAALRHPGHHHHASRSASTVGAAAAHDRDRVRGSGQHGGKPERELRRRQLRHHRTEPLCHVVVS